MNINKKQIVIVLTFVAVSIWSCKPDAVKPYEALEVQSGSVQSIAGVWTGLNVMQTDNGAVNKNFPFKTEDVTQVLQASKWKLTLNASGSTPGTFAIDHGTGGVAFFPITSGTWRVDNATKVGTISLINGVDTVRLVVGSYNNLINNKLALRQQRLLNGQPAITYDYQFSK